MELFSVGLIILLLLGFLVLKAIFHYAHYILIALVALLMVIFFFGISLHDMVRSVTDLVMWVL